MTPACDVYSLALTLYEAWTGTNPVKAHGPAATARRLGKPLPSLAAMRRDLPLELCDAIDDALDIDPARRPAPARLRAELRAAESELEDEGGLVEPATLRRVGLATTTRRRTLFGRRDPGPELPVGAGGFLGAAAEPVEERPARASSSAPAPASRPPASCSRARSGSARIPPSRRSSRPRSPGWPPPSCRGSAGSSS